MTAETATDKIPTHEHVYRALRGQILDGAMVPGQALTIRGIAEALSVSMTPAREAVRRLAAERALEMTPSARIVVPTPSPEALEELFRLRLLLEPELAERAFPNANAQLIAQLEQYDSQIEHFINDGDAGGYVRANNQFHATLYAVADAPATLALVESVWLQTAPSMRRVYGRLGTHSLVDYHEAALAALNANDRAGLREAIRSDVKQGATLVKQSALDLLDL